MNMNSDASLLFKNLKLEDPIWLPPRPWESLNSENRFCRSHSDSQRHHYDVSTISESSLVRLAMNALYGLQSALNSIKNISAAFCSDPADRTFHRTPCSWNRSLSTNALGKLLKSIGSSGSIVFLLREFVGYFTDLSLCIDPFENSLVKFNASMTQSHRNGEMDDAKCPTESIVNQAFAVAVGKVLEGYICALDTLYASVALRHLSKNFISSSGLGCLTGAAHSEITLLEVYLHTKELMTHIQALGNLCNLHHVVLSFPESSPEDLVCKANMEFWNFPRGGGLLTYLYNQLLAADPPQHAALKFLFLRSCEPYFGFIRQWIFKAEINDPYKEFIIDADALGNVDVSCEFPMEVVKVRHGTHLPSFLKDFLFPLLRAGQQLQVLKKLLELCDYITIGDHKYEDILPWCGFSSNHPCFASPLTFNMGSIEDLVHERRKFYKTMWQKLDSSVVELQFRYQQVVPVGMKSMFGDSSRIPTSPDSFTLDDSSIPSSHKCKGGSNVAFDSVDSGKSDAAEETNVVDPLEFSEWSSSMSSEEENEPEPLIDPANSLHQLEEKYFAALEISPSISIDNLFQKPIQSEKSGFLGSNSGKFFDGFDRIGSHVHSHYKGNSLGGIPEHIVLGTDLLAMDGKQYADGQSVMPWPLGALLKNPFVVQGCKDEGMLNLDDFFSKVSDENMGTLKGDSSIFRKMISTGNPGNQTCYSFTSDSQKQKFQHNFFDMNPRLSKNALFHFPLNSAEEVKDGQEENIPYIDFTLVHNPCKVYADNIISSHEVNVGRGLHSSLDSTDSDACDLHNYPDEISYFGHVPSFVSTDHSSETVHVPNVADGTDCESFSSSRHAMNKNVEEYSQSFSDMFEISIDSIIDKCLLQEILLQYKCISKLTIKLLEEGFDLEEHLLALRRYYFMELADWADLFITSFRHHKWHMMGADEKTLKIQRLFESSVQRSSCGTDRFKDRLYVYNKGHDIMDISVSPIGVHSFDFIGLGYIVDWPVSTVLTPRALKIYADIFSFLMQVKLSLILLADVWSSLKELMHLFSLNHRSGFLKCEMGHFNILIKLRHQINYFVSTLHQYVQSQLSHVSWFKFIHSLKHEVKDIFDLESVHMTYLNDALHICFLSPETQPVASIIESMLQCSLDFRSCLFDGVLDGLDQHNWVSKLSQINISQVLDLEATFDQNLNQLHLYYLMSSKHGEFGLSHFWEYLNYNGYYSAANRRHPSIL